MSHAMTESFIHYENCASLFSENVASCSHQWSSTNQVLLYWNGGCNENWFVLPIDSESPGAEEPKYHMVTIRNALRLMFINQMVTFEGWLGSWSPKSGPNRFICSGVSWRKSDSLLWGAIVQRWKKWLVLRCSEWLCCHCNLRVVRRL